MAEKVPMTALSPTMETGTIVKWRKKEGDPVKSGDVICEVETDKAAMDYEATSNGVLLKIVLPEGGQAKVGETIAIIGRQGEDISGLLAEAGAEKAAAPSAPAAPGQGGPGAAKPRGGTPPPWMAEAAAQAPSAPPGASLTQTAVDSQAAGGRAKSSPLARRLAKERGIELSGMRGSGPDGRIVKRDIESLSSRAPLPESGPRPAPAILAAGPADQVVPLSGMRRTIAKRLSDSMFSAPHYYLTVSIAMDALLAARKEMNSGREKKASLNAFLMKIAAEALKRHPRVNSSWNGDSIIQRGKIDIGLAVALPDGLVTPVVRDCGSKGIFAIDEELSDLVERARGGRLKPEEYSGAGFTISNLGSYGIEEFTAVINPPASAILAVGEIRREPIVDNNGAVVARGIMRATLSCDHRVIDGAVGAAFLAELRAMAENPLLMLA